MLYSAEELSNDPSLRWHDYQRGECLWSDTHQGPVRFLEHTVDGIRLTTVNSMEELEGVVPRLSVRRITA